jgi:hypothetical protein
MLGAQGVQPIQDDQLNIVIRLFDDEINEARGSRYKIKLSIYLH